MGGERSLADKLGLAPGRGAMLLDVPPAVQARLARDGVDADRPSEEPDAVVCGVLCAADIAARAQTLAAAYRTGMKLWLLYPKRSGGVRTDISRDRGWTPLLELGFVPVAQVAADADWSCLRFRRRDEVKRLTRKAEIGGKRP